jgi:Tol biopolymer transport system component
VGGPEKRIAEVKVHNQSDKFLAWLPDSRTLVVLEQSESGRFGIWSLSTQTRMKRKLTDPPEGVVDVNPAVSPDGRSVAFSRHQSHGLSEIYTISLTADFQPAGREIRITNDQRRSHSPVWTADGRSIVFASGPQHRPSLWRVDAGGLTKPRSIYHPEKRITDPAICHTRPRLAFATTECDVSVRKLPLLGGPADPKGGQSFKIVESTHIDHQAQYSPDGKQIAFGSNRSGYQEVWLSDGEGRSATQITNFDGAEVTFPYWSPDSKRLVFRVDGGSKTGIYVMNADGSGLRRLVDTSSVARWCQDGKWIYYSVTSGQGSQIWKMPVEGAGRPVRITEAGSSPAESPDGKFLYYAITGDPGEIWRMSTSGGEKSLIISPASDNFVPVANGVFYTPQVSTKTTIAFWDAATGRTSTVATPDNIVYWGLDVSPDRKYLLYVQTERFSRDLMLIEPFR